MPSGIFSSSSLQGVKYEETGCNKEAGDKKGDERKAFMKQCLGAKPVAAVSEKGKSPKQLAQQEKMKACNKDAGDKKLKGADRKAFMKDCLSNKG
ncbi:MAG: phosphate starvation-inducible protein PsiF [Betaproteobacteria bacterium]|nr:phosphate starvation-inducible protein PsiF [Betaproteobacteria bacterium]